MARTAKNLTMGQLASTSLTTLYTAAAGVQTPISALTFCNVSAYDIAISIYRNDGSTDYLVRTITLPAGSGREVVYYPANGTTVNSGDSIKIQANLAYAFNYFLDGSEVTS